MTSTYTELPTDEEIVKWSNEVAELTDEKNGYTAKGSRIAIHERCEGARWMLKKLKDTEFLKSKI